MAVWLEGYFMSEAISYTFVWHSFANACPICQGLDGQEFKDQDLFANLLFNPSTGKPIWNMNADHSLAHGYGKFNCKCQLEVRVNIDLTQIEELNALQNTVQIMEG